MHRFRSILAAFLAILIVSPACCCASAARVDQPAKHSCCGSTGKEKKRETACNCGSKTPRISEGMAVTPDVPVSMAPAPEYRLFVPPVASRAVDTPLVPREAVDTGPPRWRLAMHQRFLI